MNRFSTDPPPITEILSFNAGAGDRNYDHGISIAFLRNFTVEGIEPYLMFHGFRSGIRPSLSFGGYDNVLQELLDHGSHIHAASADIVVLSLMLELLDPEYGDPRWRGEKAIRRLEQHFAAVESRTTSLALVNTFLAPFDPDRGIASSAGLPDRAEEVDKVNRFIRDYVRNHPVRFVLADWERYSRICGEQDAVDYRFWYLSKAPFRHRFLNLYAFEILKIARAMKGMAKKCLLLDCDNTIWGGVVGEDGIEGIRLDRHTHPGNIFRDFQQELLRLHDRGILLALVSKNNEADVWEVLDRHPECLIRREHLAACRINWEDKVANIRSVARELNLGLDSFVFVDDNPMECELVRAMIPEVTVFEVPRKLYLLPRMLAREGLFDTLSISTEDRNRSALYHAEARRKQAEAACGSVEEYLATLDLVATVREARDGDILRIAQLTQKTNQFNLTTRRYSPSQILSFSHSDRAAVFSLSVRDRFGDSGLTGVLIAFREGSVGRIDSFLLSCRILGRNLEFVFLDHCMEKLRERWGIDEWVAEHVPSPKNTQTAGFYIKAGFSESQAVSTAWTFRCDASRRERKPIPYITVEWDADANLS